MTRSRASGLLLLLLASAAPVLALDFGGYWKGYASCILQDDREPEAAGSWRGLLRLEGSVRPVADLRLDAALQLMPTIRDERLWTPLQRRLRLTDPDPYLYPESGSDLRSFALMTDLDRLSLGLRLPFADVIAGRQAITWGTAHYVSPTDFLAPFAVYAVETEERPGVDALRLRVPLGPFSELDAGAVTGPGAAPDSSAGYARARLYVARTDVDLVAGILRGDVILGASGARAVGGAGVWLDGAVTLPDSGDSFVRVSAGADYRLAPDLYGDLELHLAGDGSAGSGSGAYLPDGWYVMPGMRWQVSALLAVSQAAMVDLEDASTYLILSADYGIAQDVSIGGGVQASLIPPGTSSPLSAYPDLLYTSFSCYF